jgi:hypothetical protein
MFPTTLHVNQYLIYYICYAKVLHYTMLVRKLIRYSTQVYLKLGVSPVKRFFYLDQGQQQALLLQWYKQALEVSYTAFCVVWISNGFAVQRLSQNT